MAITLREITADTVVAVCTLDAGDDRTQVAPNAVSIAQAYFSRAAWFRAIYDDEAPVGFLMLYDPTLVPQPEEPHFFLWRLMIDKAHQAGATATPRSNCWSSMSARGRGPASCACRT